MRAVWSGTDEVLREQETPVMFPLPLWETRQMDRQAFSSPSLSRAGLPHQNHSNYKCRHTGPMRIGRPQPLAANPCGELEDQDGRQYAGIEGGRWEVGGSSRSSPGPGQ